MKEWLAEWFASLDQDQQDTVVSSVIVVGIMLLLMPFLAGGFSLIAIFPLQFAITYLFFAKQQIKRTKKWYIDPNSNKRWKRNNRIADVSIFCMVISVMLTSFMYESPKWLVTLVTFSPLLISRTVIFWYKLPLAALYAREPACRYTHQTDWTKDSHYRNSLTNVFHSSD